MMSDDKQQFQASTQAAYGQQVAPKPLKQRNQYFSGWKLGAFLGVIAAIIVLIVNIGALAGSVSRNSAGPDGRIPLYEGTCSKVRQLNVGAHLLINILATILLGASNYCLQCASAPTRSEIDKAHKEKQWLDIGVLSRRNLRLISKKKLVLWILLVLSSLPLHLL